ncbi:MAG: hypothetical protein M3P34_05190 [Actinomycetota bacterium]|nr:hypothetical protein [Actinomycetota bacterium]
MALPPLYLEGLSQKALRGQEHLNSYKLALIESILKDTLRSQKGQDLTSIRSAMQTAVEVAQWELRPPR